ncbi:unnamed protein product [Moneuplotes crassus]|uniref:Pinin/SDK/MemA protein domain-containing protein n=1 Tax=Euplotes crassus TaxID=5936 RepID=A0AAD1XDZ5_EUPCR|nr:unnamed protein product [Moneuplotes crassus]
MENKIRNKRYEGRDYSSRRTDFATIDYNDLEDIHIEDLKKEVNRANAKKQRIEVDLEKLQTQETRFQSLLNRAEKFSGGKRKREESEEKAPSKRAKINEKDEPKEASNEPPKETPKPNSLQEKLRRLQEKKSGKPLPQTPSKDEKEESSPAKTPKTPLGNGRPFNFVNVLQKAKSNLSAETSKLNQREKVNEKIFRKKIDKIVESKDELERKKLENEKTVIILNHKYQTLKKIKTCQMMKNHLSTNCEPKIFWKPAKGELEGLITKNREKYEHQIKIIKDESLKKLKEKVDEQSGKSEDKSIKEVE